MTNLHHLRVFYEAAKHRNFTRAAEKLCITQPAVTAQVRALEAELELKLFQRNGRHLAVSESGELVLRYAEEIFRLEGELEQALGDVRHLRAGLLRIAATKTYARHVMPGLVSRFREAHPDIKVILDEGSSREVCQALIEFRDELGVVAASAPIPGLRLVPFRQEPVVLFASPRHPFAQRRQIEFGELRGEPIIMREEGSTLSALVHSCFERRGMTPTVLLQTSNSDFIKEMAQKGQGLAFLVRAAVERELEEGTLTAIPIGDQELALRVHVAYAEGASLSPAALALLRILELEST